MFSGSLILELRIGLHCVKSVGSVAGTIFFGGAFEGWEEMAATQLPVNSHLGMEQGNHRTDVTFMKKYVSSGGYTSKIGRAHV